MGRDNFDLHSEGYQPARQRSADQLNLTEEEENDRKRARVRLAQIESAERVRKYKKKEAKKKKLDDAKKQNRNASETIVTTKDKFVYQPHDLPAFFDL